MQEESFAVDYGKGAKGDACGMSDISSFLQLSCVLDGGKLCCGLRSQGNHAEAQLASKIGRPPQPFLPTPSQDLCGIQLRGRECVDSKDQEYKSRAIIRQSLNPKFKRSSDSCVDSPTLVKVLAAHLEIDMKYPQLTSETLLGTEDFEMPSSPFSGVTVDSSSDTSHSHASLSEIDSVQSPDAGHCLCDAPTVDDASQYHDHVKGDTTCSKLASQVDHPANECRDDVDAICCRLDSKQDPASPWLSDHAITSGRRVTRWHRGLLWLRGWLWHRVSSAKIAGSLQGKILSLGQDISLSRDFRPGDTIGFGSYGRVFTARHSHSGQIVAVKEMLISSAANDAEAAEARIKREIRLCEQLEHQRIVQYLGHEFVQGADGMSRLFLFMEYCCGGSVATHLRTYGPLEICLIKKYMRQLLEGLCYLHSCCPMVVHRDLKCANLLLTYDASLKIADFGSSKWIRLGDATGADHSVAGTLLWMAPEVLRRRGHVTVAVDIWSAGCCLLEMVTADVPWAECCFDNIFEAYRKIVESDDLPSVPPEVPGTVQSFVKVCLQRDPSRRPRAVDLQKHPLLA